MAVQTQQQVSIGGKAIIRPEPAQAAQQRRAEEPTVETRIAESQFQPKIFTSCVQEATCLPLHSGLLPEEPHAAANGLDTGVGVKEIHHVVERPHIVAIIRVEDAYHFTRERCPARN